MTTCVPELIGEDYSGIIDEVEEKLNILIPSKCKMKEIELAPKAKLNIVTDMIALDLAKKMEKKGHA